MNHPQTSDPLQGTALKRTDPTDTGPSLQRASILFVTSLGSFIGASLLLASL
jgi:hypothetical protein